MREQSAIKCAGCKAFLGAPAHRAERDVLAYRIEKDYIIKGTLEPATFVQNCQELME